MKMENFLNLKIYFPLDNSTCFNVELIIFDQDKCVLFVIEWHISEGTYIIVIAFV